MGELKPSTYLLAILVFTLFVVGGVSMMSIFRETDSTYASDPEFAEFNSTFNVYNQATGKIGELGDSVTNADVDVGVLGVINGLILAAWQTIRLMLTNWNFMYVVFNGLYTMFGVPAWVAGLIISAVIIMFVFAIWSAFFQREL
jgi:hypothetical protein